MQINIDLRKISKITLRWAFLVVISLIMVLKIKGVGETLSPWSHAFVNFVSPLIYDSNGRNEHTVVLFQESDLKDKVTGQEISFPVPYSKHIEVLDQIARHSPKAILVDFSFYDIRKGDNPDELVNQLCLMHQHGIKVYLSTSNYGEINNGLRSEFYNSSINKNPISGCYKIVPVEYIPEVDGFTHTFQLFQEFNSNTFKSAPLEIYLDIFNDGNLEPSSFIGDMDIFWVWKEPDEGKSDYVCKESKFIDVLFNLLVNGPYSVSNGCPYSHTIGVESLLYESSQNKRNLIKNKVILYGGGFDGSSDKFKSPANGEIPGVYLLDMVLDNLIVFGNNYKKIEYQKTFFSVTAPFLIDLMIVGLGIFVYLKNFQLIKLILVIILQFINQISLIKSIKKGLFDFSRFSSNTINKLSEKTRLLSCLRCIYKKLTTFTFLPIKEFLIRHFSSHIWQYVIIGITIICYNCFDLGVRNFLGFLIFMSIATSIDTTIIFHTSRLRNNRFKHLLLDYFVWIITIIFSIVVYYNIHEKVSNCFLGNLIIAIASFIFLLLLSAFSISILCWIYQVENSNKVKERVND